MVTVYIKFFKRLNTLIDYKLFNKIVQILWLNITKNTVHIMSYISCWKTHYQYLTYLYTFLYIDSLHSKKTVLLQIIYPKANRLYGGSVRLSGKTGNCIILSYFFLFMECFIVTTDMYSNDSNIRLLDKLNQSFLYLWI